MSEVAFKSKQRPASLICWINVPLTRPTSISSNPYGSGSGRVSDAHRFPL